jgi:Cu-processing system permease protein
LSSHIWWIAQQEFSLNRRNRWVLSFAILFSVLTLVISYFGMVTSGYAGFQDFVRTAASVTNLGGFLIPMFALLIGVFSFITNTEYLELLVTQPVPRSHVLLGRYLGLVLTVLAASLVGFGLPGIVFAISVGAGGAASYLVVIGYCFLLAIVFAGLSVLISLISKRRQVALGVALAVWVFYEVIYGVLILGTTVYLTPSVLKVVLTTGLLGNPIDTVRVLSLLQVGGPHLFGPAGATLLKLTGSVAGATAFGLVALALWAVLPLGISTWLFRRQDL